MKRIMMKKFIFDKDYERVYKFLSENYNCGKYHNWDVGRLSFTRYGVYNDTNSAGTDEWEKGIMLWENQNSEIVAVTHIEEPSDYFMEVSKEYKYLEEEMLLWIIDNIKKNDPAKKTFVMSSCIRDQDRINLYQKYNGKKLNGIDEHRIIQIKQNVNVPKLEDDFKVIHVDSNNIEMCCKIANLYTLVWPKSRYIPDGYTVFKMIKGTACEDELTWAVVNKDNEFVAYTIGFKDSIGKVIHLYPVAILENYLKSNIMEVMIKVAMNDIYNAGYEMATIAAWYKEEEDRIFTKVGFKKIEQEVFYEIVIN